MDLIKHRNLFEATEKGSWEWASFRAVREDVTHTYPVAAPYSRATRIIRFGEGRLLVLKGA